MRRAFLVLGLLLAALTAWWLLRAPGNVVYVGGPILTLDAERRIAEGLAVEGERIAAVGDAASIRKWADDHGARVVELDGRALLPGFIDAHGHFPGTGIYEVVADLNSPPIGGVARFDDLVGALAERAIQVPEGEWVLGIGYDDTLIEEGVHPTREVLDRASQRHPVAAIHVSGHLAVVNSAGLAALGIGPDTPDPEGGSIRRESGSGDPDGVLEETAMDALQARLTSPGPLDALRILRAAAADYLAHGVTTAQCGYCDEPLLRGLLTASRFGLIPLRLVLWPGDRTAEAMRDGSLELESADSEWARVGAVKLIADGSIQGYTGYLRDPYHVPPGDDPGYRGYPRIQADDLKEQVLAFHSAGWQIAVHGNGDAAIDDILDAYEAAQAAHPRDDTRHVVIHAQMTRPDQLDRMARLGVIPSFFSLHTFYWGDRHRRLFMGPERAARMSPARSAGERGIRFTIHADSPVVPMEPLRLVWAAVNRRTRSGAVVGEAERLSVAEALHAVTLGAAHQHFEEASKGSLEPGKLADLVILSRSPLDDPTRIDEIQVVETIVAGQTRYRAQQ